MKIKRGDSVKIIAGKDRGKTGTVLSTLKDTEQVVIEGVNVVKKHQKSKQTRSQGQIVDRNMPIHVSNVALVEGKKAVRVGYKIEEGKKVRVSRKTGKVI